MAELMPHQPTVEAIFRSYEERARHDASRGHLGGSAIGHSCSRFLWLGFRWAFRPSFDGRVLRLFQTGHLEEPRLIDDLRRIGVEVLDKDPETRRQWRYTAVGGHFSGSLDAVLHGLPRAPKTWALAEFKTHNAKSFRALQTKGVEKHKPQHWAQVHVYMGLAGLERCLYLAVCKDSDAPYEEWIHFDARVHERMLDRARSIITATEPPPRLSDDPLYYECGWCDARDLCHDNELGEPPRVADVSCRTCCYATPEVDESDAARWTCAQTGGDLTLAEQARACGEHLLIPPLVPWAEPVDSGDGWVLYQLRRKDGGRFANVGLTSIAPLDVPQLDSRALAAATPGTVLDENGGKDD